MKKIKTIQIIVLFYLLFSFSSCDSVVDCLYGISPNLISKELNACDVYHQYNDNVTFEMLNTNTNDYVISDISFDGNLPPGINYSILDNSINFTGVPDTKGTFEFTIKITVRPYVPNSDGSNNMCGDTSSKQYKIIIN